MAVRYREKTPTKLVYHCSHYHLHVLSLTDENIRNFRNPSTQLKVEALKETISKRLKLYNLNGGENNYGASQRVH